MTEFCYVLTNDEIREIVKKKLQLEDWFGTPPFCGGDLLKSLFDVEVEPIGAETSIFDIWYDWKLIFPNYQAMIAFKLTYL